MNIYQTFYTLKLINNKLLISLDLKLLTIQKKVVTLSQVK